MDENLMGALMPLREWMQRNQMNPDSAQISMAPDDFQRLLFIVERNLFPGQAPLSGRPITFLGFKISANYDHRLPNSSFGEAKPIQEAPNKGGE